MTSDDWRAEEYRVLRAEILANLDYQKNLVVWGTSGLVAILAIIFKDIASSPYTGLLLVLAQLLASALWYTWETLAITTERIGTYIALAHEQWSSLNWELFQRVNPDLARKPRSDGPERGIGDVGLPDRPRGTLKRPGQRVWNFFRLLPFILISALCVLLHWGSSPSLQSRTPDDAHIVVEVRGASGSYSLVKADGQRAVQGIEVRLAALEPLFRLGSTGLLVAMIGLTVYWEWRGKSTERLWNDTRHRLQASDVYRTLKTGGERWTVR